MATIKMVNQLKSAVGQKGRVLQINLTKFEIKLVAKSVLILIFLEKNPSRLTSLHHFLNEIYTIQRDRVKLSL